MAQQWVYREEDVPKKPLLLSAHFLLEEQSCCPRIYMATFSCGKRVLSLFYPELSYEQLLIHPILETALYKSHVTTTVL